jgi:hypothetical protein
MGSDEAAIFTSRSKGQVQIVLGRDILGIIVVSGGQSEEGRELHAVHPVADLLLWLRWLCATAILLWLPGHLLIGRWLRPLDVLSRVVLSFGAGMLLAPGLVTLLGQAGVPVVPAFYLPLALLVGWGAGRLQAHRRAVGALTAGLPPLGASAQAALLACSTLIFLLVHDAFRHFVAPPHVHDASNHAFMVLRIFETGSADPRIVFGDQVGMPRVLYLMGWHIAAALTAHLGGIAPYVCTWFLPLLALCLTPVALTLLWRAWGVPALAVPLGALFVALNEFVPAGILGWGGFGQIIGMFLLPCVALAVRAVLRTRRLATAVVLGVALAGLQQVHSAQLLPALALGLLIGLREPAGGEPQGRRSPLWRAVLLAAGAFALVSVPAAWKIGADYSHMIKDLPSPELMSPRRGLELVVRAGGYAWPLQLLTVIGLAASLFDRRLRGPALASLAIGAFAYALACFRDPVTSLLSLPFYRGPVRILYLQMFVLPPLMAFPFVRCHELLGRFRLAALWRLAPAAMLFVALHATPRVVVGMYLGFKWMTPFGSDDYAFAARIREIVGEKETVANFWDDGSTWAMHVSGRRFLFPCSWPLFDAEKRDLRPDMEGLLRRPWSERTRSLAGQARYLYVSGSHLKTTRIDRLAPASFDLDPRFEPVARSAGACLYRIRWDVENGS